MDLPFPLILWTAIGLLVAILAALLASMMAQRDRGRRS
jgi:LPS O-antigen subunit length determinant protein (WzzB/FepE family)